MSVTSAMIVGTGLMKTTVVRKEKMLCSRFCTWKLNFCINYIYFFNYSLLSLSANHVELQGVLERCSFEHGLCSWAASDVDTPGAEWTYHKGEDAWPHHGPHRDHTQNSDAGLRVKV